MGKDEKLYRRLKEGDKRAFRWFYKETRPKLLAWVLKRVKNKADAEEIVQDSYLSFLDSLPLFAGKASLWTFLVAISRHETADYWRKKYAKRAIQTIPFMDQVYTEKLYSAKRTGKVISKVYRQLLPEQRQILEWKYEEELPVEEIANRLKISLKAAESRLFRARQAFQLVYLEIEGQREWKMRPF